MSDIIELSMQDSVIDYLANALLQEERRDLSQFIVVFPGVRPCLYLRAELSKRIGASYHPPHILDLDTFVAMLAASHGDGQHRRDISQLDLLYNLFALVREILTGKEVLDGTAFNGQKSHSFKQLIQDFESFFYWGLELLNIFEEFSMELISPTAIRNHVPLAMENEQLGREARSIWPYLADIYEQWLQLLQDKGIWTRGERYRLASELNEVDWSGLLRSSGGHSPRVFLAGFFALTRAEDGLFSLLCRRYGAQIIRYSDDSWRPPEIELHEAAGFHSQLAMAGEILGNQADFLNKEGLFEDMMAFVLPDSNRLMPVLCWLMDRCETPFNVSMGYPLERLALTELVLEVLTLLQSMRQASADSSQTKPPLIYLPDLIRVLSHAHMVAMERALCPQIHFGAAALLQTWANEQGISFALKHELDEVFREHPEILAYVNRIYGELKKISKCKTAGEFAGYLHDFITGLLKYINAQDAMLSVLWQDGNAVFLNLLEELMESFLREEPITSSGFKRLLRYIVSRKRLPFKGMPLTGLQVLGLLETRCLNFRQVLLFDMNEGTLPTGIGPEPILPHALRMALGMPDLRRAVEIERHHFRRLISGAREVHIFYDGGSDRERSRFIDEIIWEMEKKDGKLFNDSRIRRHALYLKPAGRKVIEVKKNNLLDRLKNMSYSPNSINKYLKCPYQFYIRYCLGISDEKESVNEIDGAIIGNIVHDTLYDLYKPLIGYRLNVELIETSLESCIIQNMEKHLRKQERWSVPVILLKDILMYRMKLFLHFEKNYNQGITIDNLEVKKQKRITLSNLNCEVNISGRIDRIHTDKDGKTWIIDYKTGDVDNKINLDNLTDFKRETIKKSIDSFQLPIYLFLCETDGFEWLNAAYYRLKGIKSQSDNNTIQSALFNEHGKNVKKVIHPTDMTNYFLPALSALLEEILTPEIPFVPDITDLVYCGYCAYARTLCKAV
ncbi:MAG: PD-(D/E)XK nuclease family protein [Dissulfuribacterales bacterium]